jgi:hypothetical protein
MDRWLVPLVAAVVALAVGFGIGTAVSTDEGTDITAPEVDSDDAATPTIETEVQETCIAALDAAEQEIQAEQRTSELLDDYENVIGEATDALADFDTRRLETLLSEVETLNRRSDRLIDETRNADISAALDTCRDVLGTDAY